MGCPTASLLGDPITEKRLRSKWTLNFTAQDSVGAFQPQRKESSARKKGATKSDVKQPGIRRKVNTSWDAPLNLTELLKKICLNLSTSIAKGNDYENHFFLPMHFGLSNI